MSDQSKEIAGVVAPPPVIYGITLGLALILQRIVPLRIMSGARRRSRRRLGVLIAAAGILPAIWAALTMRRHGNNPDPSHPVVSLVVDGPFRFSRNPIYLALTVSYLGIGLLIGTLWHVILLPVLLTVMRRGVVEREEAYLTRRFGGEYHTYVTRVRRWL
jgi:protein-S-isoprenylcysteine O-methyltransferase Ste14